MDAWRSVTLGELGIHGRTANLMAANRPPLTTFGALADWICSGKRDADICGIDQAGIDMIVAARVRYWRDSTEQVIAANLEAWDAARSTLPLVRPHRAGDVEF